MVCLPPATHNHTIHSELQLRFNRKKVKEKRRGEIHDTCHVQPHHQLRASIKISREEGQEQNRKENKNEMMIVE